MIKILNSNLERIANIKNILSASRMEEINGENILDFEAILDDKMNIHINDDTIFELNNDYFDIAKYKKESNEDGTFSLEVESEHISYRLNKSEYNKEYFTEMGTPTYILGKILEGTGFTIGTVEFTTTVTYSAQEAKSRRQLLMEFIAYVGGEAIFDKFTISIVQHRGSTILKPIIKGKNVNVVSKITNKRDKDKNGNPLVSYTCEPIFLPNYEYTLGDDVKLIQSDLDISETLRLVSISYNPYEKMEMNLQFGNYVNDLSEGLYQIETMGVLKDALYNGARIGPEFGFESIRNDKLARAYFRSDGMKFQSGDGSGTNWKDRLYYEYDSETDETTLVFDGKLTVAALEAIKANIDVVVSETIIVNNLYAQRGRIAELTVNHLLTGDFLTGEEEILYIEAEDQYLKFMQAHRNDSAPMVQYTTLDGLLLYWSDSSQTEMHTEETDYPVMVYQYDAIPVMQMQFEDITDSVGTLRIPIITLGRGDGATAMSSKGRIYKDRNGVVVEYFKSNSGDRLAVTITDEGIEVPGNTGPKGLRNIAVGATPPANPQNNDLWIDTTGGVTP